MLTSGLNSLSVTVPLPCVYLMTLFSGWRAVCARLPGDDVLARHDTTQPWDGEEETGHARSICLPHRWRDRCFGHIKSKIFTLHVNRAVSVTLKSCKRLTAVFAFLSLRPQVSASAPHWTLSSLSTQGMWKVTQCSTGSQVEVKHYKCEALIWKHQWDKCGVMIVFHLSAGVLTKNFVLPCFSSASSWRLSWEPPWFSSASVSALFMPNAGATCSLEVKAVNECCDTVFDFGQATQHGHNTTNNSHYYMLIWSMV